MYFSKLQKNLQIVKHIFFKIQNTLFQNAIYLYPYWTKVGDNLSVTGITSYPSIWPNLHIQIVFLQIAEYISPKCKIFSSKLQNILFQVALYFFLNWTKVGNLDQLSSLNMAKPTLPQQCQKNNEHKHWAYISQNSKIYSYIWPNPPHCLDKQELILCKVQTPTQALSPYLQ